MRAEQISDALQFLEDGFLAETDGVRRATRQKKMRRIRWAVAAACLAVAVYGGVRLLPRLFPAEEAPHRDPGTQTALEAPGAEATLPGSDTQTEAETPPESVPETPAAPELPTLTIAGAFDSYGFEGYLAYDPSELVNNDPWEGAAVPETLPVFQNANPAGTADAAPADRVEETGGRLGLSGLTITESGEGLTVGEAEGATIRAYGDGRVQVEFTPARALPEALTFTYHNSSYADMEAVGAYLKEEYASLLDMAEPVVNVTGGDYNIYGEQGYSLYFYDGAGSAAEQTVARDLKNVQFCCNEAGELWLIWLNCRDLSRKVGDYPIITAAEAEELLAQGDYATSVPCEMPGREAIVKVELRYRGSSAEPYFLPYYRFLVELPEMKQENGLNTYGAYYVPAVEGRYLSNIPTYDGSFNK